MTVGADCEDLRFLFFSIRQQALQLAELFGAIGSPMASVKDQDDVLFTPEVRKRNFLSVYIFEDKVRRTITGFHSLDICRFEVRAVLRT